MPPVPNQPTRWRVLFVCTGNACRCQMAEAWARHLFGGRIEAHSAGTAAHGVDPRAIAVMREVDVDLSQHRSKSIESLGDRHFDLVVTVCDRAAGTCPAWPHAVKTLHRGFDDPPRLASDAGNDDAALDVYRRVRDQIRDFVRQLPDRHLSTDL